MGQRQQQHPFLASSVLCQHTGCPYSSLNFVHSVCTHEGRHSSSHATGKDSLHLDGVCCKSHVLLQMLLPLPKIGTDECRTHGWLLLHSSEVFQIDRIWTCSAPYLNADLVLLTSLLVKACPGCVWMCVCMCEMN